LLYGSSSGVADEMMTTVTEVDSQRRIRASTLAEIQRSGILGLRIADVAKGADVSVALIYKYFGDRDSLIAEVLAELIEKQYQSDIDAVNKVLTDHNSTQLTERMMQLMPLPSQEWRKERRWSRLEAKAASRELPPLRDRLAIATAKVQDAIAELVDRARNLSGNASTVPASTIAWMILAFSDGFTLHDFGTDKLTDDAYLALLTDILKTHVF
jgi:AcrR family transcriptional regulator